MGRKEKENGKCKGGRARKELQKAAAHGGRRAGVDEEHTPQAEVPKACVCPQPPGQPGCIVGTLIDAEKAGDAVEVQCSNAKCGETRAMFIHAPCFAKFEAHLSKVLRATTRARYLDDMIDGNVWAQKGLEETLRHRRCTCGGFISKTEHYDVEKMRQESEEAAAKSKRKAATASHRTDERPTLNVGSINAARNSTLASSGGAAASGFTAVRSRYASHQNNHNRTPSVGHFANESGLEEYLYDRSAKRGYGEPPPIPVTVGRSRVRTKSETPVNRSSLTDFPSLPSTNNNATASGAISSSSRQRYDTSGATDHKRDGEPPSAWVVVGARSRGPTLSTSVEQRQCDEQVRYPGSFKISPMPEKWSTKSTLRRPLVLKPQVAFTQPGATKQPAATKLPKATRPVTTMSPNPTHTDTTSFIPKQPLTRTHAKQTGDASPQPFSAHLDFDALPLYQPACSDSSDQLRSMRALLESLGM